MNEAACAASSLCCMLALPKLTKGEDGNLTLAMVSYCLTSVLGFSLSLFFEVISSFIAELSKPLSAGSSSGAPTEEQWLCCVK